jgi:hypothetical protein
LLFPLVIAIWDLLQGIYCPIVLILDKDVNNSLSIKFRLEGKGAEVVLDEYRNFCFCFLSADLRKPTFISWTLFKSKL